MFDFLKMTFWLLRPIWRKFSSFGFFGTASELTWQREQVSSFVRVVVVFLLFFIF